VRSAVVRCGCRVEWSAVAAECGLPPGSPPPARFDCSPDWAGRPSLTPEDAARFVLEYREDGEAAQRRQDELNASRSAAEAAKQAAERSFWAAQRREAEREAAIRKGAARAVDSLSGLVTHERQEEAWNDGAELAAELFDREHPVPAA
jgi:hypothetical protein